MNLLRVDNLCAGYASSQVLFGVDLLIDDGEIVTLLGRNGMGKSTLIKAIMGMLTPTAGSVSVQGQTVNGQPSFKVARAGLGLVPEGRQIFPNLSVLENLVATAGNRHKLANPWTLEAIYDLFPRLAERRQNAGNTLSGGEQQMLAIGRAPLTNPKLLILDEATEGLAPLVQEEIWQAITLLKNRRQSILLIDKNIDALTDIADRHYILEKGRIAWLGPSEILKTDADIRQRFLGI